MGAVFLLVILAALANGGSALVNLFISKQETNRTLGISSDMPYIKDGVVNTYAVRFPYRIATNITELKFSWNSTATNEVNYVIRVTADDPAVLPVLHLSRAGQVPRRTETFVVEYRCAGSKAGQFGVSLFINFSWPTAENTTRVSLRQEKLCGSQEVSRGKSGPVEDAPASVGGDGAYQDAAGTTITADQVFYIAIGCVFAIVIIIGSLIVAYFKSAKKGLAQDGRDSLRYPVPQSSPGYISQTQPFLRTDSPSTNSKYSAITGGQSVNSAIAPATGGGRAVATPSSSTALTPPVIVCDQVVTIDTQAALNDLRADRNCFELGQIELEGTFGEVRWAFWRLSGQTDTCGDVDEEEDQAGGEVPMIVKTLKPTAEPGQYDKFIAEALVFYGLPHHQNIAQVEAAACFGRFNRSDPLLDAPLLCYVHTGFGNMKKFLLRCRGESNGPAPNALRTQDLVSMGLQIVKGMVHLHRLGVLHKDIAARNCLVSEDFTVQVCDTALSRDLFPNDYHCLGDNENRPVKWLAQEALDNCQFTSASDVWAFGVTMWELLSLAQQPYPEIDPDEMSSSLQDGIRLPQPYNCPDELFGVMYCCWHHHYTARPSFEQLMVALEDFLTQLMQFI